MTRALPDKDLLKELLAYEATCKVLDELGGNARGLGAVEPRGEGLALVLLLSSFLLSKYRKHLALGLEPYDALIATARETVAMPPNQEQDLFAFLKGGGPT